MIGLGFEKTPTIGTIRTFHSQDTRYTRLFSIVALFLHLSLHPPPHHAPSSAYLVYLVSRSRVVFISPMINIFTCDNIALLCSLNHISPTITVPIAQRTIWRCRTIDMVLIYNTYSFLLLFSILLLLVVYAELSSLAEGKISFMPSSPVRFAIVPCHVKCQT